MALVAVTACASANVKPINIRPLDTYALQQDREGLVVIVEPLLTSQSQKEAFTAADSLVDDGIYPFQIIVWNKMRKEIFVSGRSVRLAWPDHQGIPPSGTSAVYERVKSSVTGNALLLGVAGAIAASNRNEAIMSELAARELKDGLLAKGERLSGILYFAPPADAKIKTATIEAALLDTSAKAEISFNIAVPASYFATVPDKTARPAGAAQDR